MKNNKKETPKNKSIIRHAARGINKKKEDLMKSLIKWNGNSTNHLFPEFPSLFDDFSTRGLFNFPISSAFSGSSVPAVNLRETDTAFELEMAAPGLEKKDFNVELEQNTLVISAQKENKREEKRQDGLYSRQEFSYQSFRRSFNLPEDLVNADEISANYKEGILHIRVPKKETAKPKLLKQIAIN